MASVVTVAGAIEANSPGYFVIELDGPAPSGFGETGIVVSYTIGGTADVVSIGGETPDVQPIAGTVRIEFDTAFAQQIYAGSDFFLMPSRFEPCGLGQMISMRYGTLPIVRATGGLKDTVQDYSPADNSGNGFVFNAYESKELLQAIQRALKLFQNQDSWYTVVANSMQKDFSWNVSAKKYIKLYQQLTQ